MTPNFLALAMCALLFVKPNISAIEVFAPSLHYGMGSPCKRGSETNSLSLLTPPKLSWLSSVVRSLQGDARWRSECVERALAGCHGNGAKAAAVLCLYCAAEELMRLTCVWLPAI